MMKRIVPGILTLVCILTVPVLACETVINPMPCGPDPLETVAHHAKPQVHVASPPRLLDTALPIYRASIKWGLDPYMMFAIAGIESDYTAESNRTAKTQYKGLFQIGKEEWAMYGEGDIYNAHDNAEATARMFASHTMWFRYYFRRFPTAAELYMIHQQGRGFFWSCNPNVAWKYHFKPGVGGNCRVMTNLKGNPYPGMHGHQTNTSFQNGWGRELYRRMATERVRENIIVASLGNMEAP